MPSLILMHSAWRMRFLTHIHAFLTSTGILGERKCERERGPFEKSHVREGGGEGGGEGRWKRRIKGERGLLIKY